MSKSSLPVDIFFQNFRFLKKTVVVNNDDYNSAFRALNKILNVDKVRSTVNFQRYYERPTVWRRRFMNQFIITGDNQSSTLKELPNFDIESNNNDPIKKVDTNKYHSEYGSETSDCSTFHPINNNSTEIKTHLSSIIEKSQLSTKYEELTLKMPNNNTNNESLSSLSDDNFSLPSVNFYVPSPKVSLSSPIQSGQSISPKYTQSNDSSPVWIKKDACYDSGLNLCEYDLCPKLLKYQTFIHEGNVCHPGMCLSDSASWNQCMQSCCLLENCEYSDYTTSSDNLSSTYYNQSIINDYWCLRFMHKWNKSKLKSSCILNQMKQNSLLWYKLHDKSSYPIEFQQTINSNNMNTNQEICPFCQMYKDANNNNFIQQTNPNQKQLGLQMTIEQIKSKLQLFCCCIPPSLQCVNIHLNTTNQPPQGQSNSTTNSKLQSYDNSDNNNTYGNEQNQFKIKCNKLSLKSKCKQRTESQQPQQQPQQPPQQSFTNRRQTTFSMFQSLSNIDMQNRKHARKALKTISLILGAFMICWTPYHIIVLIKGFCDDINTHTSCVNIHLYNLSYWLCYMNSPINPFCYALSNISFRRTFFRILRCDFQKR
ncbi:unnamed protein product [Schistosoma turkestanicum]|nr:unnamed protein product [Schistosoma turkestanicum]